MNEGHALSAVARQEAHAKAQRAKDWAARRAADERGPAPMTCPAEANEKQRASEKGK